MSHGRGFFHELQRRHVVRVAIAYAIAAWVLLQVASIVFPALGAPDWVLRIFIALMALGFPLALILAWAFELTPDGVRRTEPEDSPDVRLPPQQERVGRTLNAIVIGVLVVAVAVLSWRQFGGRPRTAAVTAPAAAPAAAPAKSIAVLPFDNLSEDKNNGYFASGMQDEILTRLAGIGDLQVISRTSTEKYASHPPDLKTVGRELGVATILEGSVQKAGDAVHINVQLIDAGNDHHLWAQSYDRDLKDIFAVERDVAQSIADALKAQLQPQEAARVASVPTTNPAAYVLYLRAREHFNRAHDQDIVSATELPPTIDLLEQALAADPKFALALAALGEAHMYVYFNTGDRSEARLAAAKTAIDRALALEPDLGQAHFALALYHYWGHRDYEAAKQELQIARLALPNSADVASIEAAVARRQGRWDEALAGFQRAVLFDPRASIAFDQLGLTYAALRRYAEADQTFSRAVAVSPDAADERVTQAITIVIWKGDLRPLRSAMQAPAPDADAHAGNVWASYQMHWWSRDFAAAARTAASDSAAKWLDESNLFLPRELYLANAWTAAGDAGKAADAYASVRASLQAALPQSPDDAELHLALALAAAGLGNKEEALREGRRAAELMSPARDNVTGSGVLVWLAAIEAHVGERDAAFADLRQVLALPSGFSISAALLKLDPLWDPLRSDPRFEPLVATAEGPVDVAAKR
jgi:TolB-like protein/Tfp pilus assembly protein PilF